MMNDIKASFNSLVRDGDWIDPVTKKAAQEKAEGVTSFIGYQEWLLQPGQLDEYYSSVCLVQYHATWYIKSQHFGSSKNCKENKSINLMTTRHQNMTVKLTPEIPSKLNAPQATDKCTDIIMINFLTALSKVT